MSNARRKVLVPLIDRANYGRMKPVMRAIQERPELELQVICSGSMVLERFHQPMNEVRNDGFPISGAVHIEIEGSVPSTMAKSVGLGLIEFSSEYQRLQPDIVLAIGDRYEMLAAVLAAGFMNICIAHVQGGEVSGSVDESIRHAITKFAHYHFPATTRAAQYIESMGERSDSIFMVGCPSSDIARRRDVTLTSEMINSTGSGAVIDCDRPFGLVVFHPVTTSFGHETDETLELLNAIDQVDLPFLWLWPNIDAGSDHIAKTLRRYRDQHGTRKLRLVTNFSPDVYATILANAAIAVGNSSSFVRDSGHYGTPVVLVGDRQEGREYSHNVLPARSEWQDISQAIKSQLAVGRYEPSTLYGDGTASPQIVEKLVSLPLYVQKRLDYVFRAAPVIA